MPISEKLVFIGPRKKRTFFSAYGGGIPTILNLQPLQQSTAIRSNFHNPMPLHHSLSVLSGRLRGSPLHFKGASSENVGATLAVARPGTFDAERRKVCLI